MVMVGLSYVSPSAVASVDLSSCRLAVLACNTNNEESQRMQAMLDGRKTADKKALEEPYRTAAVVHAWCRIYCAAKFHCRECKSQFGILTSVLGGGPVASSVWRADTPKPPRKEEEIEENEPEGKEVEEPEEGANAGGEDEAGDDESEAVEATAASTTLRRHVGHTGHT